MVDSSHSVYLRLDGWKEPIAQQTRRVGPARRASQTVGMELRARDACHAALAATVIADAPIGQSGDGWACPTTDDAAPRGGADRI